MIWYDDLPLIDGAEPLTESLLARWPDRGCEDRLRHLRVCPVVTAELYQLARHLAVTVIDQPAGPMVAAMLRSEELRRPVFAEDGSYLRSYMPTACRLLPFVTGPDGAQGRLRDAADLPEPERTEAQRDQLRGLLRGQGAAMLSLSAAAGVLIAAGLLVRVPQFAGHWRPLPQAEAAESHARAAALGGTAQDFLALRLLAVIEFSSLHLRPLPGQSALPEPTTDLRQRLDPLNARPFLIHEEALDFSALRGPVAPEGDHISGG
ncbi:SapC protein [Rhodobacter viridis]|uniref:SapC protein n=1 Tax=Rhodobacter viridis TaxID=1054202 RepID=A0A318TRJ8_9RHOB|nr:SapC family protein [Rhodobacter viridis]PYF07461.1 SapC protein [Rhodobacter viridis]